MIDAGMADGALSELGYMHNRGVRMWSGFVFLG